MKLEIKLPDPKYCAGCKFLDMHITKLSGECSGYGWIDAKWIEGKIKFPRPQKCVDENGE